MATKNCIIWGGTGQAKVVAAIIRSHGVSVSAVFDNAVGMQSPLAGVPLVGGQAAFDAASYPAHGFVTAIGGSHGQVRAEVSQWLLDSGLEAIDVIHDRAFVADSAVCGAGVQVMALAAICEDAIVGDFCIVNTNASVDHECRLGRGVHIMPGATLAGLVEIGDFATIGSNATILPRVKIGAGAMIGAGAVVTKDVPSDVTVIGIPARSSTRRDTHPINSHIRGVESFNPRRK